MSSSTPAAATKLRHEIREYVKTARKRGFRGLDLRRRAKRHYLRTWPILVSMGTGEHTGELSVPIRDISELGIGFLSPRPIEIDSRMFIKLLWYGKYRPRLPAVVRHATETEGGYLIGCEFAFSAGAQQALHKNEATRVDPS